MKQSNKTVVRNDIIVILTFLIIALVFFVFTLIFSPKTEGEAAVISLDGEIIGEYSLSEDISLPICDENGETLEVPSAEGLSNGINTKVIKINQPPELYRRIMKIAFAKVALKELYLFIR